MKIDQKMLLTTVIALMIFSVVNPFVKSALSGVLPEAGGDDVDNYQDESLNI
jgi:hypothetical protein